jgi:long-chain fatty acid transport protein
MKKFGFNMFVSILLAIAMAAPALAGGLWLYEQATPDMGVGANGRQAAALDASTASGNPAGMTRLDRSQMVGGILGIYPVTKFDVQSSSNGDNGGGNAGYFTPVPTLYYVHSIDSDLKLGIGVGSYFGLGLNYSNEWAGKYYVQRDSYNTAAINPSIGWRISPWLSVGGGFSVVYGALSARVAINTPDPAAPDGRLKYDASDVGYGYNLGALFEFSPRTRVGITYVSQVDLDFKDKPNFKNLDGTALGAALKASGLMDDRLKIDTTIPMQVALGIYHDFTEKFALAGTVNWQDWSKFGQPEISISSGNSTTKNLDYQDTYHVGIGAYYRVADPWLLMAGFGYDSSPIDSSKDRSPVLPLDETFRYSGGVQYDWSKDFSIGAAYTLLYAGEAKVNQSGGLLKGELKGKYDTNYLHFFNVNFVYRF